MVLHFLNNGGMPDQLNNTNVVLIPKVKSPIEMEDFRPISLCNISYKLISKVLANRMKSLLPAIVDDNQSAFVPSRLITDNILLASEVFHFMKVCSARKRGFMALKLDMSKAFDRVEWDYLRGIMLRIGFPVVWVDRVMEFVTSVSYSFIVNGQLSDSIRPPKGPSSRGPSFPLLVSSLCGGAGSLNQASLLYSYVAWHFHS